MPLERIAWCYLVGLSGYHVATGLVSYFAPVAAMRLYRGAYGCDPVEQRHLKIILRPWGALAIFAGCVGLLAAWRPTVRGEIEAALLGLLLLRIGYRIGLRHELEQISRIAPRRNLISIALLLAGAALLALDLLNARPPSVPALLK